MESKTPACCPRDLHAFGASPSAKVSALDEWAGLDSVLSLRLYAPPMRSVFIDEASRRGLPAALTTALGSASRRQRCIGARAMGAASGDAPLSSDFLLIRVPSIMPVTPMMNPSCSDAMVERSSSMLFTMVVTMPREFVILSVIVSFVGTAVVSYAGLLSGS